MAAPQPGTVKQLRSWLGAAKQLSAGLQNYAVAFKPLEQAASGRASAEKITWTEELQQSFKNAKQILTSMQKIYYPIPTDQIYTYSDFSQDSCAVGGRLEFERTYPDGSTKRYHGGFFSVCLKINHKRWLPCDRHSFTPGSPRRFQIPRKSCRDGSKPVSQVLNGNLEQVVTAVNDALAGRDDLLEASERHYNLDHKIDIINEAAT